MNKSVSRGGNRGKERDFLFSSSSFDTVVEKLLKMKEAYLMVFKEREKKRGKEKVKCATKEDTGQMLSTHPFLPFDSLSKTSLFLIQFLLSRI